MSRKKIKEMLHMIQILCVTFVLIIIAYAIIRIICGEVIRDTTPTTVIDCDPIEGTYYYEVTVETETGEIYAYYGDYAEVGDKINTTFNGETIVDAK